MKKENYFIDCFSGAGGFSTGMEMTGRLKCALGIEWDKYASETFKNNHPDAVVYNDDIKKLTDKKLLKLIGDKKIKLMLSGAPCQGFSTAGLGNPDDPRNLLFKHFVRMIKVVKPDYFVMENVKGLLSKKNEKNFKSILSHFKKIGYNMDYAVLNADDFGVPQVRQRLIIIGSCVRTAYMPIPKPIKRVSVIDVIKDINNKYGGTFDHHDYEYEITNERDKKRISHIPTGEYIRYKHQDKEYLPKKLSLNLDWDNLPEGRLRQARYRRLPLYGPSPTIMTSKHSYYHPEEDRYLSPREAARIQTFPNDFDFGITTPSSAKWRQIGNAVPPLLAKAIGEHILFMDDSR